MTAMESMTFSASREDYRPPPMGPKDAVKPPSLHGKLMASNQSAPLCKEKIYLVEKKLDTIDHVGGNYLLSQIHIDASFFKELCTPMGGGVGGKTSGQVYRLQHHERLLKESMEDPGRV